MASHETNHRLKHLMSDYGMVGVLTCVGVGYVASLVLPHAHQPLQGLTIHTRRKPKPASGV